MKVYTRAFSFLLLFALSSFAQEKPTPEEAKKFLKFYYEGQRTGVVLIDVKVCNDIVREGEKKNECESEPDISSLKKGDSYYLWMLYLIPKGDNVTDIIVQFNKAGITRFTRQVSLSGSIRYRTWRKFSLDAVGEWEIKVLHIREDRTEELGKVTVTVVENLEVDLQ